MMTKNCENCDKAYETKQEHSRFCSNGCRTENYYRRKFQSEKPFIGGLTENSTDVHQTDKQRLNEEINANSGMFDRLMNERESRITDKILLAEARMEIKMLQRELEDAKSMSAMMKEIAPHLVQVFTSVKK